MLNGAVGQIRTVVSVTEPAYKAGALGRCATTACNRHYTTYTCDISTLFYKMFSDKLCNMYLLDFLCYHRIMLIFVPFAMLPDLMMIFITYIPSL